MEDFEICGYRIKLTGTGEILRCEMYAHIGRIHSTETHEFWKVALGRAIVRDFQTGLRQTAEAVECPSEDSE
jgi:hypothetical protein